MMVASAEVWDEDDAMVDRLQGCTFNLFVVVMFTCCGWANEEMQKTQGANGLT